MVFCGLENDCELDFDLPKRATYSVSRILHVTSSVQSNDCSCRGSKAPSPKRARGAKYAAKQAMGDETVGIPMEEGGRLRMIGGNPLDITPQMGVSIVLGIEVK